MRDVVSRVAGVSSLVGLGVLLPMSASWAALTIDLSSASTDIGTAATAIVGVLVLMLGARMVFRMLRGG